MSGLYLSVTDASDYLSVKKSFLYSLVESREIPHYRLGRLIRFKSIDLDKWMEGCRREKIDISVTAREILWKSGQNNLSSDDLRGIIKKSIASVTAESYNPSRVEPDRIKGLGKEVEHGTLS
jgi:excisionase family DNA binding protein